MQRLRAAKHGRQRLNCSADYIVVGLLSGKRAACSLSMKTQCPGTGRLSAESFRHSLMPDAACRTVLGDLFKEIAVRVKEKRKSRNKFVYIQPAAESAFNIFDPVTKGERQFLDRCRSRFSDVITAYRNRVEFWRVPSAEFKSVNHKPHRRLWRIDVFLLRYEFLQDVVLQCAANILPVHSLLFSDGEIHGPNDSGGRVDRHRRRHAIQWNLVKENFHIGKRTD